MTAPRHPGRDDEPVDALVADRYLDALLAAHDGPGRRRPADADPLAPGALPSIDPALARAAHVLHRSTVRVHPSFRFEERLAARLSQLAAAQEGRMAVAGGGRVIPFRAASASPSGGGDAAAHDPLLPAILAGELDPTDEAALERAAPTGIDRRPLLVGGAITSAALSIVGVAWVAWRASRPGVRPARRGGLDIPRLTGGTA